MTNQELFTLILTEAAKAGVREMQAKPGTGPGRIDVFALSDGGSWYVFQQSVRRGLPLDIRFEVWHMSEAPPIVVWPARKECKFTNITLGMRHETFCVEHHCHAIRSYCDTHWICDADQSERARLDRKYLPKHIRSRNNGVNPTNINVIPAKDAQGVHVVNSAEEYERLFGRRPPPEMFEPRPLTVDGATFTLREVPGMPPMFHFIAGKPHTRETLIAALVSATRIHATDCRCQLCDAVDAGSWYEPEAERWLDHRGREHGQVGYALRTWLCGARTERDCWPEDDR